jgi:cytochrome c556
MSDVLTQDTPQTAAEYEALFARLMEQMEQINVRIQQDQEVIDRLRAEASAYKAEAQRLKAEGTVLSAEIRARLDNIRTTLDRLGKAA